METSNLELICSVVKPIPVLTLKFWIEKIKKGITSLYDNQLYLRINSNIQLDVIFEYLNSKLFAFYIIQVTSDKIYKLGWVKIIKNPTGELYILDYDSKRSELLNSGSLDEKYKKGSSIIQYLIYISKVYTNLKCLEIYDISKISGMDLLLIRSIAGLGSMYKKFNFEPMESKIKKNNGIIIDEKGYKFRIKSLDNKKIPDEIIKFRDNCLRFVNRELNIDEFKIFYIDFAKKYKWDFYREYILYL